MALTSLWVVITAAGAGRAADGDAWVQLPSLDWLGFLVAVVMFLGLILIIIAMVTFRGPGGPPTGRRRALWPMLVLVLIAIVFGQRDFSNAEDENRESDPIGAQANPSDQDTTPAGRVGGGELAVLILMLGAAAAVVVWSRLDRPDEEIFEGDDEESLEAILAPAIERAGGHLLSAAEPRAAVLLAYADLEAALMTAGHAPASHETPNEHLTRVLGHLSIDAEPLLRLADLYQRARFSRHDITVAEQHDAAAALQRVRSQLVVTP